MPVQVRSGRQSGFLDPTQKRLQLRQSYSFSRSDYLSLGIHYSASMCNLYISFNFYICDLRLDQSCDFYITNLWEIMKCVLLRVNKSKPPKSFRIMTDSLICNDPGVIY